MLSTKQKTICDIVHESLVTTHLAERFLQLKTIDWAILEIMNQLYHLGVNKVKINKLVNVISYMQYVYALDSAYNNRHWDKMYFWLKYPEVIPEFALIEPATRNLRYLHLLTSNDFYLHTMFPSLRQYTLCTDGIYLHNKRKDIEAQYPNFSKHLVAYESLPVYESEIKETKQGVL